MYRVRAPRVGLKLSIVAGAAPGGKYSNYATVVLWICKFWTARIRIRNRNYTYKAGSGDLDEFINN